MNIPVKDINFYQSLDMDASDWGDYVFKVVDGRPVMVKDL